MGLSSSNLSKLNLKYLLLFALVFAIGFSVPIEIHQTAKKTPPSQQPPSSSTGTSIKLGALLPNTQDSYFYFAPQNITLSVGEIAQIVVYINSKEKPVDQFSFVANYDPTIVKINNISLTPLFTEYPLKKYGEGKIAVSGGIRSGEQSFSVRNFLLVATLEGISSGNTRIKVDQDNSFISSTGKNITVETDVLDISVLQQ